MEALAHRNSRKHIVILVHGIRTFGAWQDRLSDLLHQREPGIEVHIYKYGYFSALAFLVPFLRMIIIRRFRRYLRANAGAWEGARVDIVAHSFGTYVTGWALRRLPVDQSPRIHTIILCGSVLKQLFPWNMLVGQGRPVTQVINDCGTKDIWPLISRLVVFGMGSAGRHGFAGAIGTDVGIINRYHPLGHSDFFTDAFMGDQWAGLLSGAAAPAGPRLISPTPGFSMLFENVADPVKVLLVTLLLFGPFIGFQNQRLQAANAETLRAKAEGARATAEAERLAEEQKRVQAEAEAARAATGEANASAAAAREKLKGQEAELARLKAEEEKKREELARVKAEKEKTDEESHKLLAQANEVLYRAPQQSLWLALRAAELSPSSDADSTRQSALEILRQRRQTQIEEVKQWYTGRGWFAPPRFEGTLSARFSRDGKYVLLPTERSIGNRLLPGTVYLLNNETLKLVKLEPPTHTSVEADRKLGTQQDEGPMPLDYMGFSSSGKKIYLSRSLSVEVYSIEGTFEQKFRVTAGPKPSISLVDSVEEDRLIVVGDMTGDVWPIVYKTRKTLPSITRELRLDTNVEPLLSFELSPSGRLALLVYMKITRKKFGQGRDSDYDQFSRAYVWKVGGEGPKSRIRLPHKGSITYATFKPTLEEDVMLTAGEDGIVALWKLEKGSVRKMDTFDHAGKPVGYAAFSEDGQRVITLADDQKPRVWNLKSAGSYKRSGDETKRREDADQVLSKLDEAGIVAGVRTTNSCAFYNFTCRTEMTPGTEASPLSVSSVIGWSIWISASALSPIFFRPR
jgi:WD40 repeat protein/pimeloyl-ACP methyl ester carboxylesterase